MAFGVDLQSLRRLWTSVRSGLRAIRATPLVFAASSGTMAAGLLLLGAYLLVVQNMHSVIDRFSSGLAITAYLTPGATAGAEQVEALRARLAELEGVAAVSYVSPERALERLRADLGAEAGILEGLGRNPLPGSFELELAANGRSAESVRALSKKVAADPAVADVRYGEGWLEGYTRVLRAVEWLGVILGGFLLLVLGAIVAGTVRLAVLARADEIQIQRLVGAGGVFVRLPFYIEAALQGAFAASLAIGVLWALFWLGLPLLLAPLGFLLGRSEPEFLSLGRIALLFLVGTSLGLGGAAISLVRLEESP